MERVAGWRRSGLEAWALRLEVVADRWLQPALRRAVLGGRHALAQRRYYRH